MTPERYSLIVNALTEAARLWSMPDCEERMTAVTATLDCPNSFTREALDVAIQTSMARITPAAIDAWIAGRYGVQSLPIAVLNAGNIPFVGLHDLLAVLCTGHSYQGVLSSKSPHLLPAFASTATQLLADLPVTFSDFATALSGCEAVIATGSDRTVELVSAAANNAGLDSKRIVLRGTRVSVAVLDGRETRSDLDDVARDALLHEGRGCLNAAIVFAPYGLDQLPMLDAFERFRSSFPPHRTTLKIIREESRLFKATGQRATERAGVLLVDGAPRPRRPGIVVWSRYTALQEVENWISVNADRLQLVILSDRITVETGDVAVCRQGQSQDPALEWRPDRIDIVRILSEI